MAEEIKQRRTANQIERLARIVDRLAKAPSTARQLATDLGVSERQIRRDVAFLSEIDFPITSDRHGYAMYHYPYRLPDLLAKERMALRVTTLVMRQLGLPGIGAFEAVLEKVSTHEHADQPEVVRILPQIPDVPERLGGLWIELFRSIRDRQRLCLSYAGPSGDCCSEREVDPYGLVLIEGDWRLVARCNAQDRIRHFSLRHISTVRAKGVPSTASQRFSLDEHLATLWESWTDCPPEQIILKVSAQLAERWDVSRRWHPSQRTNWAPDGRLLLQFMVCDPDSLIPWIMSWGDDMEVVRPLWLKEHLLDRCRRILDRA